MDKNYKYIDLNYLNNVSQNKDFQKKIFSIFRDGISKLEVAMKETLLEKKYWELSELIHKAKSNVAILGMIEQSDELKRLELDLKEEIHVETYEKRIQDFLLVCNEAVKEIEDIEKTF